MNNNIMGHSIRDLERWRGQEPLDHRKLNQPVDAINDMNRGVGVPRQVMATVGGAAPAEAKPLPSPVLVAMEAGLTDDHLVCRAVGSDPELYTPILVAKPWLLRKTPWDGQTRGQVRYEYDREDSTKRIAYDINDSPDTPEADRNKRTELISPRYLIGDELIVSPSMTGVEVDSGTVDDEGVPIFIHVTLIDMTGRDWTVFFEQL